MNEQKTLQLALIGAGGIGKVWAAGTKKTNVFAVRYVVDVDSKKAEDIAKDFPGCKVVATSDEALADPALDAVIVATPHNSLAKISKAAFEAGKHVLCEKPGGISAQEVAENCALAKEKKLIYMIGLNHRYHPGYMRAKQLLDEGAFGELSFVRARYGFGGRPGYQNEWRFKKEIGGGGELIDQGMHMIDISRWFLGEFVDVRGFSENFFWGGEVEDNGFLLLRTKDHKVSSIHVSWTNWEWVHSFEVFGKEGYAIVEGLDQRYRGPERITIGKRDETFAKPVETIETFQDEKKDDSFARELVAFEKAIRGEAIDIPRGEDIQKALEIVEKIYATS
jgi:predicted dehydrogenase